MNTKGYTAKLKLDEIKYLLKTGQIDYDEAKEKAKRPLEEMNEEIVRISKEHNMRPRKVSFAGYMR